MNHEAAAHTRCELVRRYTHPGRCKSGPLHLNQEIDMATFHGEVLNPVPETQKEKTEFWAKWMRQEYGQAKAAAHIESLQAEVDRLLGLIKKLEHAKDCSSLVREGEPGYDDPYFCDCFKSEATND